MVSHTQAMTDADLHAWVEQWRRAGPELEEQRARELRDLTDEHARAVIEAALDLGTRAEAPPHRRAWSGLVIQQAIFHGKGPSG
jgi:hypothetical protein